MSKFISHNTHYGLRRTTSVYAVYNSQKTSSFLGMLPIKIFKRRNNARKFAKRG